MVFVKNLLFVSELIFVVYLFLYSTFILASIVTGSISLYLAGINQRMKDRMNIDFDIYISILVPAYNEEVTIIDTVKSLLSLKGSKYEIIVIDDGSSDSTAEKMVEYFDMILVHRKWHQEIRCQEIVAVYECLQQDVPIYLVKKRNGGKADALNAGINVSTYDYFLSIDADSVLEYDSLEHITRPIIEKSNVAAVGGLVRISNGSDFANGRLQKYRVPRNTLAAMQVIEYGKSFYATRIMLDSFNGNLIISGTFGLFNRELVCNVGGYETDTVGEDMELVMKLHVFCIANNIPYVICYAPDAICWTQVPERIRDLAGQRRRWHIGLMQSMFKYKEMINVFRFGALSMISYMYFLIYELASPLFEIFGTIVTIIAILFDLINEPFMILFFVIYTLFNSTLGLTVYMARMYTDNTRLPLSSWIRVAYLCILEMALLRPIVSISRFRAMISARKLKSHWGNIKREEVRLDV